MMSLLNNSRRYFIYFISILFLPLNLFSQDVVKVKSGDRLFICLLYTSDAADERSSVDLGGRSIIKKKNEQKLERSLTH